MSLFRPVLTLVLASLTVLTVVSRSEAATRVTASCNQPDVLSMVNAAANGDIVVIRNGSCSWMNGINVTKQIHIRAESYSPTPGGSSSRSVTITHNAGAGGLFSLTTGNTHHVRLSGIKFLDGTGGGPYLSVSGSGSKVALIDDNYFQITPRYWSESFPDPWFVRWSARGGVLWNNLWDATGFSDGQSPGSGGACLLINSPTPWLAASTWGMQDANGDQNLYMEDSTFLHVFNQALDCDHNCRMVLRHNTFQNTQLIHHGPTSGQGGRQSEIYDNAFQYRQVPWGTPYQWVGLNRYVWIRGGTTLMTNNTLERISSTDWGTPDSFVFTVEDAHRSGANGCCTGYMCAFQTAAGGNGTSQISDPVYIWNNTGTGSGSNIFGTNEGEPHDCATGFDTADFFVSGRDYFLNQGAKQGYTPYTYPHPLRSAAGGPPPLPEGNNGIAAGYPGDANIQSNANVLFFDNFESYSSAGQLTANWNSFYQGANTRIAAESGNVFAGSRSLEFTLPAVSGEVSNAVVKNLSSTQDTLFVRVYTKFDPLYHITTSSNHNGIRISSRYPGPGNPPDGTDFFLFLLQNTNSYPSADPGYTNLYVYHPEQRSQWGDEWYPDGKILPFDATPGNFGPYFIPRANFIPQRDRWYSYELMVKANTPGQRDGRAAVWIDGALIADFQNLRVRDDGNLKIDQIQLELHAQAGGSSRPNKKWYDNVVVAKSYIGPMAGSTQPDTTPPSRPKGFRGR